MGIFDIFGGKKSAADNNEESSQEEALLQQKEKALAELKEAHAGLEWPTIQRLNPVNVKDADDNTMEETVTAERKDEIGEMIYDEDLSPDTLRFLSGQELLFLLTTFEVYNKKAPLPEFEKNHRKVYNELINRIRDSKSLYVLYDKTTGYPFIDHGFANVYFEKELAEKAAELFARQFRKLVANQCKVENESEDSNDRRGFFDYLYYIGIENLIIDNGAYRARFKRSEIVAAPFDWNNADKSQSPVNPALNFAMTDFLEELRWPVKYDKRAEVLKAKEMRMLSLIRAGKFIVPIQHEGPAEVLEDGRLKFGKDTKIKFLVMKTQDNKQFIPVYTDAIEFSKRLHGSEWSAAVFGYQDILKFASDKDGIRINPDGQGIVLPKDRMMAIEVAGQQAEVIKSKNAAKEAVGKSADDAVTQALNQAMAHMDDK